MILLMALDQPLFWVRLLCLVGVIVLCFLLWRSNTKLQESQNKSLLLGAKNEELENSLQAQRETLSGLESQVSLLREEKANSQVEHQKVISTLEARDQQIDSLQKSISDLEQKADDLMERVEVYRSKVEDQDKALQIEQNSLATEKSLIERLKDDYAKQSTLLEEKFKSLTTGILKQREQELSQTNQKGLDAVISPLKEVIGTFRKRVDQVHTEQTKGQGQLENELKNLRAMNTQLSERAENLTSALRNDKKKMGNWGELQLERLLENAGLDQHCFRREENFKTEEGANQRPDFIIDLPENKCLIIDSKVSLNAYVDSVNAANEEEAVAQLKQHTTNVRNHIKGLADKSYDSLRLLNSPDFVFMFMPNEAAYLAAFEEDASLFDFAYDKKVAVVTPNTLLPILRTVSSLWRIEKQNQSTADLAYSAEKVHKKLTTFLDKFERVGAQLATVQNSFSEAQKTLSGRGSLLGLVKEFEEKGVKVTKTLPPASELD